MRLSLISKSIEIQKLELGYLICYLEDKAYKREAYSTLNEAIKRIKSILSHSQCLDDVKKQAKRTPKADFFDV